MISEVICKMLMGEHRWRVANIKGGQLHATSPALSKLVSTRVSEQLAHASFRKKEDPNIL